MNAHSSMKKSYYTANNTANFLVDIVDPPTLGKINMSLDANTTVNIKAGRYVYDVILVNSANSVTRVLEGIINIIPGVTKYNEF